jgi:hypothetical protein
LLTETRFVAGGEQGGWRWRFGVEEESVFIFWDFFFVEWVI